MRLSDRRRSGVLTAAKQPCVRAAIIHRVDCSCNSVDERRRIRQSDESHISTHFEMDDVRRDQLHLRRSRMHHGTPATHDQGAG